MVLRFLFSLGSWRKGKGVCVQNIGHKHDFRMNYAVKYATGRGHLTHAFWERFSKNWGGPRAPEPWFFLYVRLSTRVSQSRLIALAPLGLLMVLLGTPYLAPVRCRVVVE